jgi:hypothetical protein
VRPKSDDKPRNGTTYCIGDCAGIIVVVLVFVKRDRRFFQSIMIVSTTIDHSAMIALSFLCDGLFVVGDKRRKESHNPA